MTTSTSPAPGWHMVEYLRTVVARQLGVTEASRRRLVDGLCYAGDPDAATYWLQLVLALGMATLGLALDSVAVVIGAMLVSPLMQPIIELSLSLLVGASWPLVNALVRVLGSVALVVGVAATITLLLPFNEPTGQILARTTPTALDLIVAIFCAIAAGLTYTRPASSAASAAAGTAIGISLVPPLCASGFGVGIGNWQIAEGALLLFVANFCAILAFATLFFWLVGLDPEPAGSLPAGVGTGLRARLAARIDRGLAGRRRLRWRLGLPAALLASVLIPLQVALNEVAWEVRTRAAIVRVVAAHPALTEAVALSSTVGRGAVDLRATIVGSVEDAARLTQIVTTEIGMIAEVVPTVRISAVPKSEAQVRPSTARVIDAAQSASDLRTTLDRLLSEAWPARTAGPLLGSALTLAQTGQPQITVVHRGSPLEPSTTELLGSTLSARLNLPVTVSSLAVPATPLTWQRGTTDAWMRVAADVRTAAAIVTDGRVCVTTATARTGPTPDDRRRLSSLLESWAASDGDRLTMTEGASWSVWLGIGGCEPPAAQ